MGAGAVAVLEIEIRPALPADAAFLVDMLITSCFPPDGPLPGPAQALRFPHAARWLRPPVGPGDQAVVAWVADRPAGAAVGRRFTLAEPGWGVVAPEVLELSMAVVPAQRGRGVGRALLRGFLARLVEAGERAASLAVSLRNEPALRLYRRGGFREVKSDGQRLVMLWKSDGAGPGPA